VTTSLLGGLFLLALGFSLVAAASSTAPASLRLVAASSVGVAGFLLMNRLLRGRRELGDTLDQSERYIASVAELSRELQLLLDPETNEVLYASGALLPLLGVDRERLQGEGVAGLLSRAHPEDRTVLEGALRREEAASDPEVVAEVLVRLRTEEGVYRWLRIGLQVFHRSPDGRPQEVLLVASDHSEAKAMETLVPRAMAFESLGSVAGGVVHDLNNALMAIQLQVERASGQTLPEGLQQVMGRLGQESRRAADLSRQLLACTGRGRSQRSSQSLNDVIREALPLLERMVSDPVSLVVDLESDLPPALVDPIQVRHAALAMVTLSLASLGSLRGEIQLHTTLVKLGEGYTPGDLVGDFLCLEVRDKGRGLGVDMLRALLVPDLDGPSAGVDPSLLALHWIAREHKGTLDISSRPGEGAWIRLLVPVAQHADITQTLMPAPEEPEGEGRLVLVVEDEAVLRGALRLGLEESGFRVLEAEDGVEGFAAFVRNRDQLAAVLLDLTMPRMNGDELVEEIRALRPELPVILMSGYSEAEATATLGRLGLTGFLSKPCSLRAVREALNRALAASAG